MVRTDKTDPATNEEAVAVWRLTLKDPDERKVGRAVSNDMVELGLATIPGFFGVGGGPGRAGRTACTGWRSCRPIWCRSTSWCSAATGPWSSRWHRHRSRARWRWRPRQGRPPHRPAAPPWPPLGRAVGARSGDKGGNANLGVFARSDEGWAWLDGFLTVDRLRALLPETADLAVDRYRLPHCARSTS